MTNVQMVSNQGYILQQLSDPCLYDGIESISEIYLPEWRVLEVNSASMNSCLNP